MGAPGLQELEGRSSWVMMWGKSGQRALRKVWTPHCLSSHHRAIKNGKGC